MPVTKLKSKWSSGNLIFYGDGNIEMGEDDDGIDVKFYGATADAYMLWDESADELVFDNADVALGDGDYLMLGDSDDITLNFDGTSLELEGAAASTPWLIGADAKLINTTLKGTFTVGKDDTGHDVKFFGATSGKYFLWDESADKLIILGTADLGTSCEADAYTVGGVAGVDYSGAGATITTITKGIVTAAS